MVCGADHQLFGNGRRKFDLGRCFFVVGIGLCRLLPELDGSARMILAVAILGIAGYLAFLMTIDVPMYVSRWRAGATDAASF